MKYLISVILSICLFNNLALAGGKWRVINYWAEWCGTCTGEIKELNRFYAKNKSRVTVLAIYAEDISSSELDRLTNKYGIKYPSYSNNGKKMDTVPVTEIFNPAGKLVKVFNNGITSDELEQEIK